MSATTVASGASIPATTSSSAASTAGAQSTATPTTQHNATTTAAQNNGAAATPAVLTPMGNRNGRISLTVPASTVGGAGGQIRRLDYETLTMHPTKATKVIAHIRKEHPNEVPGDFYEQDDEIPILDTNVQSPDDPKFYFLPNLTASKIPPKNRASKKNNYQPLLWVRQGNTDEWKRVNKNGGEDEVWKPCPIFRRFNKTTNKYEEAYVSLSKINNADPNNAEYAHSYNKWIDQIKRRRDDSYEKVVYKDHWTIPERRALCSAINDFVREKGLRRFGFGEGVTMASTDLDKITAAVNAAGTTPRKTDAVRGQIHSSHANKNKVICELITKAEQMRARLKAGERVRREERYPEMAIPEETWPVEDAMIKNKKRKAASIIEDTDSGESDAPIDREAPARALKALPKWTRKSLSAPGSITPKHKKLKIEDDAGNEVAEDEAGWDDTDEHMTDAPSDDESGWETEATAPTEEEVKQEETLYLEAAIDMCFQSAVNDDRHRQTCREEVDWMEEDIVERGILTGAASEVKIETDSDDNVDETLSAGTPQASDEQDDTIQIPVATPSPQKRKRAPEDDGSDGSDGDDEAEMASPQRSVKKMRTARGT